jgi:UDP-N-acetyl-D-glucosamine dehydrogenase
MDVIAPPRRLAVLGQGYVGLPVTIRAVEAGYDVVGFDVDKSRIDRLKRAESFVDDVSGQDLRTALDTARFHPTDDEAALEGFDVAVVSVPTPLRDGAPDLDCVRDAALALARHVRPGCTVVLESTTYPGTTEDEFVPLLESAGRWKAGQDFHVGYSPERIDPGNRRWTFRTTPKVVSGIDPQSLDVVAAFYRSLVDQVVEVPGPREAELAKLLENTFRHVNIALVNELAVLGHELGVDVWSVIDAAATKPFGFMPFRPGPGVGGHCLPIDPSYLSWQVRRTLGRPFRFVEIANDVNDHMPDHVVQRITARLNRDRKAVNGSRILLIGLAYKPNSGDARQSPAIAVARHLADQGAELRAVDPFIEPQRVPPGVALVEPTPEELAAADLVVVLTDHDALDWELIGGFATRVFDTRNRLGDRGAERL